MVTGYWVTQIVRAAASYSIVGGLIVSQALTLLHDADRLSLARSSQCVVQRRRSPTATGVPALLPQGARAAARPTRRLVR
jgi:hypothetical protein